MSLHLVMQTAVDEKGKDYAITVDKRPPVSLISSEWNEIFLKTLIKIGKWTNRLIP
jgi:hypothetical protein